jgi:autotransporter-associated beta strand protein
MNIPLSAHARLSSSRIRSALICGLSLALPASMALAQTSGTWTSTTGGNWSDTNNWSGGTVATGGSTSANVTATFSASGTQTVNVDTNQTVQSIVFSTGTYTISSSNGVVLTLAGSTTPIIASTGTISATLGGTQGFTMNPGGSRTLTLSGDNTYSGVTTLTNGNIIVRSNNALGATGTGNGTIVTQSSGAFPQLHIANNVTTSEDITLRMNQTGAAAGSLVGSNLLYNDSGTNTLSGTLVLDRTGSSSSNHIHWFGVQVTGNSSIININGNVSGAATAGQPSGTYADPTRFQFRTTAATAIANVNGSISDGTLTTGGLSVYTATDNTGIVRLNAANTYTGSTVHQKGTLLINNTTGSGTGTGAVSVASTAVFGGTGIVKPTGANGITFSNGSIVAPGDVLDTGSAIAAGKTLTFDLGSTTGIASFDSGSTISINLNAAASLPADVSEHLAFIGLTTGVSQVTFNSNVVNFSVTGGLLADGVYTLASFSADNAYTGQWTLGTGLESYSNVQLIQNANSIQLSIGAIPEPSTYAAIAGLAAIVAVGVRQRRRS